ncbi:MAG: hypothetical protein ACXVGE_22400, partial [Blastococcus sp.]
PIAMVRDGDSLPNDVQEMLGTAGRPVQDQLDYLNHQFNRHKAQGTLHWAVAPFAPQRCTPKMLQGCCDLAGKKEATGPCREGRTSLARAPDGARRWPETRGVMPVERLTAEDQHAVAR